MGVIMGAEMDMAPPAAIGGVKWPPPAITARAGCITATGEREHQRLYLPLLMGRTDNEVSRSVEKYPVWDWSGDGGAAEGNLYSFDCVSIQNIVDFKLYYLCGCQFFSTV